MRFEIEKRLNCLVGLPLFKIGRASNMMWFSFGNGFSYADRNGSERIIGEYALHIQSCWRIRQNNRIKVAYRDIYYPSSTWTGDVDSFDWDIYGMNRCDERTKEFQVAKKGDSPLIVESIMADDIGGFTISFSDKYALDVFPDDSKDAEYWRFFSKLDESKHFVVSEQGIVNG